jgi:hypothetical protein
MLMLHSHAYSPREKMLPVDGKAEAEGVPCITLHEGFQVNCLNIHVLETSYYELIHNNGPREENQEIHE